MSQGCLVADTGDDAIASFLAKKRGNQSGKLFDQQK
jgi:hypothetical protein